MSNKHTRWHLKRYGHEYVINVDDEFMEHHYAKGELCEQPMLDWMVSYIPKGGIWVDAGANVGNHALVFATACKADAVVALEPADVNYEFLLANLQTSLVGNVVPMKVGCGEFPDALGIKLGGTGKNCQFILTDEEPPSVQVLPIDLLVNPYNVRVLKLDVEGMEFDAVRGAMRTIECSQPEIFVEIWERPNLDKMAELLRPLGYKLIQRWNVAPTYHFSTRDYPVLYVEPVTA